MLIAREWVNRFTLNLAYIFLEITEILEGQISGKVSSFRVPVRACSSCSSETKHDGKKAPRSKLFISKKKIIETKVRTTKTCLVFELRWNFRSNTAGCLPGINKNKLAVIAIIIIEAVAGILFWHRLYFLNFSQIHWT